MKLNKGSNLPNFKLATGFIGDYIDASDLINNYALVYFWSMSCYVCKENFHKIKSWKELYHERGLRLIAIHMPRSENETNKDLVEKFISDNSIEDLCLLDNFHDLKDEFNNVFGVVPFYYLFDKESKLIYCEAGTKAIAELDSYLSELFKN